jgi:uncharacterized protein with beta-barrel porin domain
MTELAIRTKTCGFQFRSVRRYALAVLLATTALGVVSAHAQDATWVGGNAGDPNEWVEPNNWTPTTIPVGIATFTNTGVTTVANDNGVVTVGALQFSVNAQAYTFNIDNPFIVNGTGINNANTVQTQTFNITSGNALVFQNGSSASAGAGPVSYNNQPGGNMVFQNTSTAGNATITNNASGFLQFFNTSNAGTAIVTNALGGEVDFFDQSSASGANITNNGTVNFFTSSTAGSATINNAGAGAILTFGNTSTAGSMVFTSAVGSNGTITFNDQSAAGSAHIDLVDTTLTFNNGSSAGSAVVTMSNSLHPGTITFNATSTAANANITNVGNLDFFNTANAGSAIITNTGTTNFFASTSALNATITNGGNLNFQGQSTAASAIIVNNLGGTTTFGVPVTGTDTATAGSASITNHAGGSTLFTAATTAGNATIVNDAGGFLQFGDSGAGASTATAGNATITNNGGMSFNANTTAGSAIITTNNGGNVFFFDNSTGGNAQFITNAGGTFDMSGLTAPGMTAGSIAGAGDYILGAKALTVGGNNLSSTVSGVISGAGGSLIKVGTGTLTLSGINTYTGPTMIDGGVLSVNGSIVTSSLTTVNAGGTLGGNGVVGNTLVNGGTLSPGNSIGLLTVQGNLTFTAGATYLVEASPANADRINVTGVTGTATLGGATVNALFAAGTYVNKQYTILNASGGVSGTFSSLVNTNLPANFTSSLSYDAHDVFLNLTLNFIPPTPPNFGPGLNINQQNVANTLVNFFNTTGGIPLAFGALTPAGLTIASGELGTGVIQSSVKADDLFLNLMLDPTVAGRAGGFGAPGGASGYADEESMSYAARRQPADAYGMYTKALPPPALPFNRWSVWVAGYGGSESVGGNAVVGSQDLTARIAGGAAGADYKASPDTLLGFAMAGAGTNYSLANGLGSGRSDVFQVGAYGRQNFGAAYVQAAFDYGWHDVTTNRTVALAGFDILQARFQANTFSGRVEGGYRYITPFAGITPYAAVQAISFHLPAYAEQSLFGGPFALNYAGQTTTDTRTELGLRGDKSFAMSDGMLTLRSRLAWAHDYDPNRAVTALFQTLPGTSFVVNGARPDADSALVSAGAEMKWLNGFSLAGTFDGEFSGNVTSYVGKAVAKYSW